MLTEHFAQAIAAAGLVPPDTIHADGQLRRGATLLQRGETLLQRYRVTQVTAMKRLAAMPGEEAG